MLLYLPTILSSAGKTAVLEVLFAYGEPLALRHIEYLSGLGVRSVQLALNALLKERVLTKKCLGNQTLYQLNKKSKFYPLLIDVFSAGERFSLKDRAKRYKKRSKAVLSFSSQVLTLISYAKKKPEVASYETLLEKTVGYLEKSSASYALFGGFPTSLYRRELRNVVDLNCFLIENDSSRKLVQQIIASFGFRKNENKLTKDLLVISGEAEKDNREGGVSFYLSTSAWGKRALERSQSNFIEFSFGKVPVFSVEDIIISKLRSLSSSGTRYKDLGDLQEIFQAEHELDSSYLLGRMRELSLSVPEEVSPFVPELICKLAARN